MLSASVLMFSGIYLMYTLLAEVWHCFATVSGLGEVGAEGKKIENRNRRRFSIVKFNIKAGLL